MSGSVEGANPVRTSYVCRAPLPETYYATNNSVLTVIYFVAVVIFGTYVIMTLFIAILLEGFAGQDDAKFELEDMTEKVP